MAFYIHFPRKIDQSAYYTLIGPCRVAGHSLAGRTAAISSVSIFKWPTSAKFNVSAPLFLNARSRSLGLTSIHAYLQPYMSKTPGVSFIRHFSKLAHPTLCHSNSTANGFLTLFR